MGFLLLVPFLGLRFGLLARLDRSALARAAHFPPLFRRQTAAYYAYQLSNTAILLYLLFLRVKTAPPGFFWAGAALYAAGTLLLAASVAAFAAPSENGLRQTGIYRLSRNPMYVAYFVFFVGCALLTQSLLLLGFVAVFQLMAHRMIRAEERWCAERFGDAYLQYCKQVRRYF